jgi:hypothetical protein
MSDHETAAEGGSINPWERIRNALPDDLKLDMDAIEATMGELLDELDQAKERIRVLEAQGAPVQVEEGTRMHVDR